MWYATQAANPSSAGVKESQKPLSEKTTDDSNARASTRANRASVSRYVAAH
jgi:hypothetical protein